MIAMPKRFLMTVLSVLLTICICAGLYLGYQLLKDRRLADKEVLASCRKTYEERLRGMSDVAFSPLTISHSGINKSSVAGTVSYKDSLGQRTTETLDCVSVAMCCN